MTGDTNKIVNITQLPETYNIELTDLFTITGEFGNNIIAFDNIVFDIEQMAFEEEFEEQTTDLQSISGEVDSIYIGLSGIVDEEVAKMNTLATDIDAFINELECSAIGSLSGRALNKPDYC